jgi:RNA polymerase sigma factor (sigma-70 family)
MSAVAGRTPLHVGGLPDDDLVGLARAGHDAAFDAIVHRYRAPLQAYCRRWLDPHRAEEVVQHTLMKAFLCVRDDTRPLVLRPWLYRVAHNAALNAVEKKGSDWEQLDENYDGVPQPPQVAEQRARFLEVVGEIEALPARQREALLLNEFEGRCYADIAVELGTSESGVRGLLRRARRQLRETAAALLLPFPVLRELVRSDGGRGLQVDRASELIGTAGAAGGVGAAGGLAKVAAGVLAAGTIAGGGAAIEHGTQSLRTQDANAADTTGKQRPAADGPERSAAPAASPTVSPYAVSHIAGGGAHVTAGAGLRAVGGDGSLEGIETNSAEPGEPGEVAPKPLLPDALIPVETDSQEGPEAEEEPASGEVKDGGANNDESADSGDKESTAGEGEAAPDEQKADGSDPNALAATPEVP